jgi:hypothetical protein
MDYSAFSHGQTQSKIWLCETLEPYVPNNAIIANLGSWYNLLGYMMLTRNYKKYQSILGIDIDPNVKSIADNLCEGYMLGKDSKLQNITSDANVFDYQGFHVVINCSVEHMDSLWFYRVPKGTLICIQSSDVVNNDSIWKITNPNISLDVLKEKYPLSHYIFMGDKHIGYEDWGYNRFMIIGVK